MNWSADWGDRIWQHLWNSLQSYIDHRMSIDLGCQALEIFRDGHRWHATWTCRPHQEKRVSGAIVVLALGPGHERTDYGSPRYWDQDQDALDQQAHGHCILVSGAGDGGLIDAGRRCLYVRRRHQRIDHLTLLSLWVVNSEPDTNGTLKVSRS